MSRIISVAAAALIFNMCTPPSTEEKAGKAVKSTPCSNFREGMFVYKGEEYRGAYVTRTETKQTEIFGDTIVVEFNIIWDADCSYKLAFISAYSKASPFQFPYDTVYVSIVEVLSDSSYRYKATRNGEVTEYTMIKL